MINTKELRRISNKEKAKAKRRLSLRNGEISGRTDSIPLDLEKIMSDWQDLPTPRWLTLYFKNWCIEFLRR